MHFKSLLPVVALLLASTHAAETVFNPDFRAANGGRPAGWFVTSSSTGTKAAAENGHLLFETGTANVNGGNRLLTRFRPVYLAKDGDSLLLRFTLAADALPEQNNNFRFGIYDSLGETLNEDAAGVNPMPLRKARGYTYWMASGANSEGRQSRYIYSDGAGAATALTSNQGQLSTLGDNVGFGYLRDGDTRTIEMELTRRGEGLEIKVLLDGKLLDEGRRVEKTSGFTFDLLAFSGLSPNITWNISNLSITTTGTLE